MMLVMLDRSEELLGETTEALSLMTASRDELAAEVAELRHSVAQRNTDANEIYSRTTELSTAYEQISALEAEVVELRSGKTLQDGTDKLIYELQATLLERQNSERQMESTLKLEQESRHLAESQVADFRAFILK